MGVRTARTETPDHGSTSSRPCSTARYEERTGRVGETELAPPSVERREGPISRPRSGFPGDGRDRAARGQGNAPPPRLPSRETPLGEGNRGACRLLWQQPPTSGTEQTSQDDTPRGHLPSIQGSTTRQIIEGRLSSENTRGAASGQKAVLAHLGACRRVCEMPGRRGDRGKTGRLSTLGAGRLRRVVSTSSARLPHGHRRGAKASPTSQHPSRAGSRESRSSLAASEVPPSPVPFSIPNGRTTRLGGLAAPKGGGEQRPVASPVERAGG